MSHDKKDFLNIIISKLFALFAYVKNSYIQKSDNKKCVYQVEEFYRSSAGKQMVVAKVIDSPRGFFKLSAIELALKRRDLLSGFSIDEIINIIGLAATEKEARITYKKPTTYKYFAFLAMLFGAVIITANIASSKLISILGYTMTGGALVYPVAYSLGDIITEVYGYKRTRQLIWGAIICNLFVIFFITIAILEPPSPYWHYQEAYALILGSVPRIIFASLTAYWAGEFVNSFIIAKLKIIYNGQHLWIRILSAAIFGITIDASVFVLIAFWGTLPIDQMIFLAVKVYLFNIISEIITIPFTMWLVSKIKAGEHLDIFDVNTKFTPFSLDVTYNEFNNRIIKNNDLDEADAKHGKIYHPRYLAK
ncbi:MAG TPA: queuosine precursor transporter [Gammaproteobacteria bacterium]|nr:queuosine precursor transporter [Gammaproteobacteria bacterium]